MCKCWIKWLEDVVMVAGEATDEVIAAYHDDSRHHGRMRADSVVSKME